MRSPVTAGHVEARPIDIGAIDGRSDASSVVEVTANVDDAAGDDDITDHGLPAVGSYV